MDLLDLIRPKWKHADWRVRQEAVGKLNPKKRSHFKIIANMAKNDSDSDVRKAAVDKLDPTIHGSLLADIAKNASDYGNRRAALDKLDLAVHESLIVDIVKNDSKWNVRCAAVDKLDPVMHESLIVDIVKNDSNFEVRTTAMDKLDPAIHGSFLADIVKNDSNQIVSEFAVRKLGDDISQWFKDLHLLSVQFFYSCVGKDWLDFIRYGECRSFTDSQGIGLDRKSTRLNSSHTDISRMPSSA